MTDLDAMQGVGQNPAELDQVRDLYNERKPRAVLEIGVWHGGTLKVWLTNGAPELVVAVDPVHLNPHEYESWRFPDTQLVVVHGAAWDEDATALIRAHAPYDWAFIDGDHIEAAVIHDVALVEPLMRAGGLMLLHDITAPGYPPLAPRKAFNALLLDHEGWEINEPRPGWYPSNLGSGIGVVQF